MYASARLTPRNRLVSLFLNREVGRVSYGNNSVFVEFICSLVLLLCRNGVASSVISMSCSAEVNYYFWDKLLYASVLLQIRNRLVSSFLSREVGRVGYGGGSVFVISTNCSAEVNYYFWNKPLYASVRISPGNRLVSLFLNREVGRVSYGNNSVFVEFICSLVLTLCRNGVAIL